MLILIISCNYSLAEQMPINSPAIVDENKPLTNNITWGLFFGMTLGFDMARNDLNTDANLTSYNYSKDGTESKKSPSFGGFSAEAKVGLIKTAKNFGFRIYGYYGATWDSMQSFGLNYTPINADDFYEDAYLEGKYYGGIIDLLFGNFQDGDNSVYFSIGGGYQITNYNLSGKVSLGYKYGYDLDNDIYRASISGNKIIQSPVINVGMGFMTNKHHLFEVNLRYLFVSPTFITDSQTQLVGTSGSSFYNQHIPNNTPITIRETISRNININVSYMYKF